MAYERMGPGARMPDGHSPSLTPDVYHFHLKDESGDWYNNHYLISPNERHILGPFVEKNGKIEQIVAQTLTRVSYDVPKKYKRGLRSGDK